MSTSGTYNFGSPINEQIITDAYERTGVVADFATDQKIKTALRSINFILQSWVNKRLNLFTVRQGMLALTPGKTSYLLPDNGIDVLEVNLRTSVRNLGGMAASSSGIAGNAFDGNPATACTQTAPNGNISYSWNNTNHAIEMVGVMSAATNTYTLTFQYSFDGASWTNALVLGSLQYVQQTISWFVITIPTPAPYFRIIETGGATLNISELYFNTNINDLPISRGSRSEYMSYPNKNQPGTPSRFWVDRQIEPVLYLYQTPNSQYNNIFYTYKRQIQDIGSMTDTAEVATRFLEALTSELAYRLAVKEGKLDRVSVLKSDAVEAFRDAAFEDGEKVSTRVIPKPSHRWSE